MWSVSQSGRRKRRAWEGRALTTRDFRGLSAHRKKRLPLLTDFWLLDPAAGWNSHEGKLIPYTTIISKMRIRPARVRTMQRAPVDG